MALIACRECAREISDQAHACPGCGAPLEAEPTPSRVPHYERVPATKSRSLAVVLALLLGGLGIHKFYLDKPGRGVVYLLFCWTLIPAVVGVIEAFYYLAMSDAEFHDACAGRRRFGWLGE